MNEVIGPLIGNAYSSLDDAEREIAEATHGLREAALLCLQQCKDKT